MRSSDMPRRCSTFSAADHRFPAGWLRGANDRRQQRDHDDLAGGRIEGPPVFRSRRIEYLSWPAEGLDPDRLAAQTQVIRIVAMVAAKVGEPQLDREVAERFRRLIEESEARKGDGGGSRSIGPVRGKPGPAAGVGVEKLVTLSQTAGGFFGSHSPADA
jgi:hypothetical protein